MSEEQKSSAGLFRLKDLMEMEVDQEETFPTNNSELRPQHPPKPVPTPVAENVANTAMVEAIRAARSAGAPDTGEESLLTPGKLPAANLRLETRNLDALAKHAQVGTAPAAAGEYRTGEHQRVVAALQKDERRRGWKSVLLFVVIPAVLLLGAGGALALYLRPPLMIETPLNARTPALDSWPASQEIGRMMMVPEPEPEPEVQEEPERESRRERRHRREREDREDRRRDRVDRSNLF